MTIYLGADHRGFALKEKLKELFTEEGYSVVDVGATVFNPDDDYPDFAIKIAQEMIKNSEARGILICGSGFGVDITANRFPHVRAALAMSPDHIYAGRNDDDVNVLVLAANFVGEEAAVKIAKTFLSTPFAGEARYQRRLEKIDNVSEAQQ